MYSKNNRIKLNDYIYKNRTLRYLIPLMKIYGKNFINMINIIDWKAFAIADKEYNEEIGENFFCLCKVYSHPFKIFINYIRDHDAYVDDYIFSFKENLHMFVIKNPKSDIITDFLRGNYSKMLSEEQIEAFYLKKMKKGKVEFYTDVFSILTKRKDYIPTFKEKLELELGYVGDIDEERELDFPPLINEEVFNYDETSPYSKEYERQKELIKSVQI